MSKKEESGIDFSSARFSAMADEDGSLRWKEPRVENTKAEERSSQRSSNQHRAGSQGDGAGHVFLLSM